MNTTLSLIDGFIKGTESYGQGALIAVLCAVMVFVILALIIAITYVVNIVIAKFVKNEEKEEPSAFVPASEDAKLNTEDENAVVVALVAAIDLRNQTNKNVKVVSIKEIK